MITVTLLFALAGFLCTLASIAGKVPLWAAVLLINVVLLLMLLPK